MGQGRPTEARISSAKDGSQGAFVARPSIVAVVVVVLAMFATPNLACAVRLSDLFAGETISAGNLTFSDWTFHDIEIVGGGIANADRIEVYAITDDPVNPGLFYALRNGLETPKVSAVPTHVELTYSYRVTTSGPPIEYNSAHVTSFDAVSRAGSRVRVIQTVERTGTAYLSQVVAFARATDTLETPNLFASDSLQSPRTSTIVETAIAAGGAAENDYIALREYEQRFGWTVPEPSTLAWFVAIITSAAGLRPRRRTYKTRRASRAC
jgi:hypothetical protein